jgi:hypothetical protein
MSAHATSGDSYHPWATYIAAREEARRRGDRRVGTDHLVLGLLHDPVISSIVGVSLEEARGALESLDREALSALGVEASLDAPPLAMRPAPARPTVSAVLRGRLPLTPAAKKALQEAAKPMRRGHEVTAQQVLLRVLDLRQPDPAAGLFAALGLDVSAVRQQLSAPAP